MKTFRYLCCILIPCLFFLHLKAQQNFEKIDGYKVYFAVLKAEKGDLLVLREFTSTNKHYYLVVDPQLLKTKVISAEGLNVKPIKPQEIGANFSGSPYIKAIRKADNKSVSLQNAGIAHGLPGQAGVTLTIDLCPSHKPLDRVIFTSLIKEFQQIEKPVPVALSVSGKWMLDHQADIQWLKKLIAENEIDVTWINHSYNHKVSKTLPLQSNFLLEPGTNMNIEVLETEKLMLKNGLVPSVFFRFPGLVSDRQLVVNLLMFGLIPVGSDAWLAKGQAPAAGSIVLIHGNGNEPLGVKKFIQLLQQRKAYVMRKQWLLFDLRESIEDEFKN